MEQTKCPICGVKLTPANSSFVKKHSTVKPVGYTILCNKCAAKYIIVYEADGRTGKITGRKIYVSREILNIEYLNKVQVFMGKTEFGKLEKHIKTKQHG